MKTKTGSPLLRMSWHEFEVMVCEYFKRMGYMASVTAAGADGGVDVVLTRGSEMHFVQCKQWRANRVPVSVIRELYGVITANGADGGYVITSGQFTRDAIGFAVGRNIELIDGQLLLRYIRGLSEGDKLPVRPHCPLCGHEIVRRVSRRSSGAGLPFWGWLTIPGLSRRPVISANPDKAGSSRLSGKRRHLFVVAHPPAGKRSAAAFTQLTGPLLHCFCG